MTDEAPHPALLLARQARAHRDAGETRQALEAIGHIRALTGEDTELLEHARIEAGVAVGVGGKALDPCPICGWSARSAVRDRITDEEIMVRIGRVELVVAKDHARFYVDDELVARKKL